MAKEIVLYASGACAELEAFAPAIDEPPSNYMAQVWEALNAPALVAS